MLLCYGIGRGLAPSLRYGPDSEEATSRKRQNMPNIQAETLYRLARVLLPLSVVLFVTTLIVVGVAALV